MFNTMRGSQDFQSKAQMVVMELETQKISSAKMMCGSCNSHFPSASQHRRSQSAPHNGLPDDVLSMSNQPSHCSNCHVAQLIKEIAVLELEITHLERYLLSQYQTAFNHHLVRLDSTSKDQLSRACQSHGLEDIEKQGNLKIDSHAPSISHSLDGSDNRGCPLQVEILRSVDTPHPVQSKSNGLEDIREQRESKILNSGFSASHSSDISDTSDSSPQSECPQSLCAPSPKPPSLRKGLQKSKPGLRSLAYHLGSSLLDQFYESPNKLSEEILRCIAAIYCKLANPPLPHHTASSTSPPLSTTSSSTFSPPDASDVWSPQCDHAAMLNPCDLEGLRKSCGPYNEFLEVLRICMDDERFNYASSMLQNFRSLIQRLENVDPGRLKHEEKLAFWINIHNALMMHAHLAYGDNQYNIKNAPLNLKASYNVGGHLVNGHAIQNSILGCQIRRPSLWLRTLFSPGIIQKSGSDKHIYALDPPEPHVYFALSSGSHSDPAIRLYTAKGILEELKLAREEFIQTNVHIHRENKIILPKILNNFAKDSCLDLLGILEMVHDCLPKMHQKVIQRCLKGNPVKCIQWAPHISSFRYIIHRELVEEEQPSDLSEH